MTIFKPEKVISSIPPGIDPDTIYYVRVGEGFDLFLSDTTGSIAYKLNAAENASSNIEVLTSQKNLGATDPLYQYLSTSSSHIVNLPIATSCPNKRFIIVNTGNGIINLYENNSFINLVLDPKGIVNCHSDGINWNIFVRY